MKQPIQLKKWILYVLAAASFCYQADAQDVDEMMDMSLEDLMNIEITSVSKKAERLQDVASSIYVLTAQDIENSNATTLHEALRLVPGYWGVQNEYSNVQSNIRYTEVENSLTGTVLYLLDGTPIQDQMFSSFDFRNFDIPMDEIDRIEVIRGSGGTVYGANSATGVVNIFTKDPSNYDGINARAEAGSGGYASASIRAGGNLSDQFGLSGYAKMRLFDGFGSLAGKDVSGNVVVPNTRFTQNYDAIDMFSFGLKGKYTLDESASIAIKTHYNTLTTFDYANYFGPQFAIDNSDILTGQDIRASRFVGSIRMDKSFSDDHSVFVRLSTNAEDNFERTNGGYETSNSMYDLEIQDNISLGNNDLSFGVNYRFVNFDISNINSTSAIDYLDKQAKERLIGFFAQDKIQFADGKFNLIIGIKGENYSLINDEFYFSPMAKVSYIPTENFTLWGGFTQSFSTPGFTNTNVDFAIFQTPDISTWTQVATQAVFNSVYQQAIEGGADDATATSQANSFVASQQGQTQISQTADNLLASNPNIYVQNGSNTVPTKFQTWEAGLRATIQNQLTFEINGYYTTITDGIGVTPDAGALTNVESPTQPGRFATYFLYGNYIEGSVYGAESSIKIIPASGINFELTHSYTQSDWKLQENPDFDIFNSNIVPTRDRTRRPAIVPEHVFRFKGDFALPEDITLGFSMIYGTKFASEAKYLIDEERYTNLVVSEDGATVIAQNGERTIVNIRLEKSWLDNRLSTFIFGNDLFNDGIEANTRPVFNVTRSQIARMVGIGASYKIK